MIAEGSRPAAGAVTSGQVRSAGRAVGVVFFAAGFAFASWASRIPQVRDALRVSPGVLGLVLLCLAAGTVVALPLSGLVVTRLGESRTVAVTSLISSAGLATVAFGYSHGIPAVTAGLAVFGYGSATWDVAMNVQGAAVERALGRAVMPKFHAGWSIGTVAGAGAGAAMVALGVPVTVHLLSVAAAVAVAAPAATRSFLPHSPAGAHQEPAVRRSPLAAWAEPRTLLIGVFVLCMAFSEGTGNDWLSLAVIGGYHGAAAVGALTFAVFLAAMTAGRWFGPRLLDRYGRVKVLRAFAATALAGLLVIDFGVAMPAAMAGAVLMGVGTSLGFPVGLSSAADDPRYAAGRVSTASSIGYLAFLGGPPVIGFLADHVGVLRGILVAGVLLAIAFVLSGATAPIAVGQPGRPAAPRSPSAPRPRRVRRAR